MPSLDTISTAAATPNIPAKRPQTDSQAEAASMPMSMSMDHANQEQGNRPTEPVAASASDLLIELVSPTAKLPVRGSASAAGCDLFASENTTVPARGKALVQTGLKVSVPSGTYGRIAPRSGLAVKHFIDTGAGVIDADYRGLVGVVLFNHSDTDFSVAVGDRIAQLICERIVMPEIRSVASLDQTVRGDGGFGSTGGFAGAVEKVASAVGMKSA